MVKFKCLCNKASIGGDPLFGGELVLDLEEAVVLGGSVGAAQGAGFDLAAVVGNG